MVGIDVTELPFGYTTFFQQGLELFDLAVVYTTNYVLGGDYSGHWGTPQGVKCNYAFSVLYAFATPAALMSSVITVADVAKPRNVAKSPDAKSDSRQIPPAVVDA
jgi:hypothetical protein